ncbi:iron complex outermembrane recepter protein [Faunimonas pinastri]|uniref:Iron complex outermembrane recepter protein n=1 Tax=Faunimonas pinastri TaxID=1855383 RepID=A0A1H9NJ24_9HYPH|nr:TonB-dependent siderophore receptor [Faunimonas pinastri]SER35938.1 iron complex outermembrane recepter protein [Faunimonas pinastri]
MRASPRLGLALLSGAALLTIPATGWAQDTADANTAAAGGDTIQLSTVEVQGSGETAKGPVPGYVASQSAVATKTDTPIREVPQSIAVLGREEIEDRQAQSLDEALRYTAGVRAQTYGPDPRTEWLFIRGFQVGQDSLFRDGLAEYGYAFAGFKNEPFGLDRIEVLRGPASVLYGGSSPGGLINLVSKHPTTEPLHYVETGVNSNGNAYGAFDMGGKADPNGVWSYRLTGLIHGGGTQTDKADDFRGYIAPAVTFRPNDSTTLTLLGSYEHDDVNHPSGFLPYYGTVKRAPFGRIASDFFYSEKNYDKFYRQQEMIGYEFEHKFDGNWTVRQNLRYSHLKIVEQELAPYGYVNSDLTDPTNTYQLGRYAFRTTPEVNFLTADTQAQVDFATGPLTHKLLFGLDYRNYHLDDKQGSGLGTSISAADPQYSSDAFSTTPYLKTRYELQQLGTYVQDQVKLDKWLLTLSGRYDHLWTDVDNRLTGTGYSNDDGAFSGRAGLAYLFDNGLTPYVSVSHAFNTVIGTNYYGQAYKPEEADEYEAGLKYQAPGSKSSITVSAFNLTRTNTQTTDPNNILNTVQIGEVRSRGVEAEGVAQLTNGLKAIASITAYDLEVTDDPDASIIGKRPTVVPDTLASLWLDYTLQKGRFEGVSFGGGVRYIGKSYADTANTLEVPDATLFDAAIRYQRDKWGIALNVNNILDKKYVSACSSATVCSYGDRRTAYLKASYRW